MCQIEALKTDTSVRLGGRRRRAGGYEEIEEEGTWGCILRLILNEAVCSLGNPPLQVLNKAPFFPSCFHRIFTILSNKEGEKEGISSPLTSIVRYCLIPPPSPVPSALTLCVASSHVLKVIFL